MKLGVCVPYRNRELHLHEFIPKTGKYLKEQGIDFQMYFCHQVDDKLFNRGATKNIAAKHAIEDGCDYVVFHDIDMIPEKGADYSFPIEGPRHIATKISQMDYQLKYHEYFGGAVLFSKEHLEVTNGYSNGYWDWGMEDDDLFWRCHKEGLTNDTYLIDELKDQGYLSFNGNNSKASIPYRRENARFNQRSHTVSILTRAYQIPEKSPVFLIGDKKRQYIEYPLLRVPGYDYGLSFNTSRAFSLTYWNTFNKHNYMWLKRYDGQWSWLTAVFDAHNQLSHFYLNGTQVDSRAGHGSPSPYKWEGKLKKYNRTDILLGHTSSDTYEGIANYFRGDIAKVHIWDRALDDNEVQNLHTELPSLGLIETRDFSIDTVESVNGENVTHKIDTFSVPNSILPYRKDGWFRCLPHEDEGIINGQFAKGETTAKNERRYVLEMQKGKIDYKEDGIKQVQYELVSEEELTPWAKMINIKL